MAIGFVIQIVLLDVVGILSLIGRLQPAACLSCMQCVCVWAEDERDLLYFMRYKPSQSSKSKWSVEQIPLTQTKLDGVEVEFKEPIDKYEPASFFHITLLNAI